MREYILSIDQGTTSSRALLFDRNGNIAAVAQKEFTQHFPFPGWVEHDAAEIWSTQASVCVEAMQKAGISSRQIAAIGITNQRETTVLWNKTTGKPVAPAIVWQDRRTAPYCDELKARGLEEMIRAKTGLIPDAYFSATKIRWILQNVPEAARLAEQNNLAFGTIDSWLIWKLTDGRVHATDASNASRTMLFNIHTLQWDDELLALFEIPRHILPEVKNSADNYGETENILGPDAIPITGVAGDQQAALFGQLCHHKGMAKNTYGTGCFVVLNTGNQVITSSNRLVSTVAWMLNNQPTYALEGSIFIGGAIIQWLRDGLQIIQHSSEVEALAREVSDNGGVFLVPALAGLGAPHWDAYARGLLIGITRGTTKAHIARAALESIAYQTQEVLQAMQADLGAPLTELRVDGGATANTLLMQFQADIANIPLVKPALLETTAMGAAFLAGLGANYWTMEDLKKLYRQHQTFTPSMETESRTNLLQQWHRAVERSKGWVE
jgi:glycerol kinase